MSLESALAVATSMASAPAPAITEAPTPVVSVRTEEAPNSEPELEAAALEGNIEAAPVESKEKETLQSSRFASIAKKEAALVQKQSEFKKQEEKLKKDIETVKSITGKAAEFERLKAEDPVKAMKWLGFTEADIVNFLAQEDLSPEEKASRAVDKRLTEFEEKQKKSQEEAQKAAEAEAAKGQNEIIEKFKGDIKETVAKQAEKYEYVSFYGNDGLDLVFSTVEQHLQDTGVVMSIESACEKVEAYYEAEQKAYDEKLAKLKKRGVAVQPSTEDSPMAVVQQRKAVVKGLTNKMNPTIASTVEKRETQDQKKARIVAMLTGRK